MRLIGKELLHGFKKEHADAKNKIESWESEIGNASWKNPHEMLKRYPKADSIGKKHTIFNICGNKYRLWVLMDYMNQIVLVKKIGTHEEYNKWEII